ncbi:hypothetical protein N7504_010714 [Penicillium tannophilum]|nr:hypothetical protein N7504_010714 [Penicillium tannophilum]
MDGLSAAASVIGVVSLAVQLADGAHTLLKFLKNISDAPAEIYRLQDLLTQIDAMMISIQNAFQYQRQLHGDGAPVASDTTGHSSSARKKSSLFARYSWAHFKLALKKEDIVDLEQQLGHTLQDDECSKYDGSSRLASNKHMPTPACSFRLVDLHNLKRWQRCLGGKTNIY